MARHPDSSSDDRFAAERTPPLLAQYAETTALLRSALMAALGESGTDTEQVDNTSLRLLVRLDLTGPMRPRAIQDLTGLSSGGVTKLIDRLESARLVERRHDISHDARGIGVHITGEGRRLVSTIASGLEALVPEIQRVVKDFTKAIGQP